MSLSNISKQTINPEPSGPSRLLGAARAIGTAVDQLHAAANYTQSKRNLEHALYTTSANHEAAMAQGQQAHTLGEAAATSEHTRRAELLKGINSGAEPGTEVNLEHGDFRVKYTKKNVKARTAKTQTAPAPATTTPTHSGPTFVGMPSVVASAPKAPAAPQPSATTAQPTVKRGANGRMMSLKTQPQQEQPKTEAVAKPTVTRGAGGRMVSLDPQKSVTKTKKKPTPKKTEPTVTRGAGGRMVSLKNK